MENHKQIMTGWIFSTTKSKQLFDLAGLKLTAEYTLSCLSNMKVGESVVMSDYAIKRIK